MKYCSVCGKELVDDAVVCPSCGCRVSDATSSKEESKILHVLIKVFMVLGCISTGAFLITLCWTIPMTVSAFRRLDARQPIGVGFKVCTLLFVNLVAGILLLCTDTENYL